MLQLLSPVPVVLFTSVFWLLFAIWVIAGFPAALFAAVALDYTFQRLARYEVARTESAGDGDL